MLRGAKRNEKRKRNSNGRGLLSEIERCSKLRVLYDEIPGGVFGASMIQQAPLITQKQQSLLET